MGRKNKLSRHGARLAPPSGTLSVMNLLTPVLRDYAWGTISDIPAFMGIEPTGLPVAEAWWGAHEEASSTVHMQDGSLSLDKAIAANPLEALGETAIEQWGPRLPFLLKILAVAKPLSIQVHPKAAQAFAGYARENQGPLEGPRAFHDPFHKPEMVVALTPMRLLVGVRPLADVVVDLEQLGTDGARHLSATLTDDAVSPGNITEYIRLALSGDDGGATLAALSRVGAAAPEGSSLRVSADALASFPADAGALVALALNVVDLEPGEAAFTDAGTLHSYQSGLGIEIMANSDNIARAGLTPKPVDVSLLLDLAVTEPTVPERPTTHGCGQAVTLTTRASEFALTLVTEGEASIPAGPRIVLVTAGEASVAGAGNGLKLVRGQSAFVPHRDGEVVVTARGTAVVAHLPPRS